MLSKKLRVSRGRFSWRDFSNEYVLLILNWISKFGVENIPEKILEVHQTIKILHTVCDEMYKDIKKILKYTQFKDIEELFYCCRKKNFSIPAQLISFKLTRNCIFYKISIRNLQKVFLEKKITLAIKKNFDLTQKKIC